MKVVEIGGEAGIAYLPVKLFNWKKNRIRQPVVITENNISYLCQAYPHELNEIHFNSDVILSDHVVKSIPVEFVDCKDAKEIQINGDMNSIKIHGLIVHNNATVFGKSLRSNESDFLRIVEKTIISNVEESIELTDLEKIFIDHLRNSRNVVLVGPLDRPLFINKMAKVLKEKILILSPEKMDIDRIRLHKFVFIDNLDELKEKYEKHVEKLFSEAILIGGAMKFENIAPILRKMNGFSTIVRFPLPDFDARYKFLLNETKSMKLTNVDLKKVATDTHGYTEGDLSKLCRSLSLLDEINQSNFDREIKFFKPSFTSSEKHENVSWDEIGGLQDIKDTLKKCTIWPTLYKDRYTKLGISAPRGILMYGPPGTGKTKLVKALATNTKSTFLYLNTATIYSQYVGDSEESIRNIFDRARRSHPSIIFFDELDTLVGNREIEGTGGVEKRVLSTLLNEMDGIESLSSDVIFVGATNRPDMIDSALMRPGRLDFVLYVRPPNESERYEILKIFCRKTKISDETLRNVSAITDTYTGAELESLCRETIMSCFWDESIPTLQTFIECIKKIPPQLTLDLLAKYQNFETNFLK
jgi:transitional endoplasmic reticulum ATPase